MPTSEPSSSASLVTSGSVEEEVRALHGGGAVGPASLRSAIESVELNLPWRSHSGVSARLLVILGYTY